jgi:serine/threonine-protein kinase
MPPRRDDAHWPLLSRLLDEALDLPPGERERWLEELTGEHRLLLPRLRELLAHAPGDGKPAPLETIPKVGAGLLDAADEREPPVGSAGERVGPFRLIRQIGEGGQGSVWLAERTDGLVQRPVALKLPRGTWHRAAVADRLAREREILASLTHPHIARLYDAGVTSDGQPWLALELVEGRPLDEHARLTNLDTRARIGLFLQVADAVAYAHAHLVVHRDLKPANVLVDAGGQAHLLDFGIARLLERGTAEETALTRLAGRALTPGYASPEQVAGLPVGVATDVYSLGVVLYELLTGARPYRLERGTAAELEEAILRAEVPRPSTVAASPAARRLLRGDLETIVLTALKKRPEERYPTADALAEDLRLWLDGRPVRAQPVPAAVRRSLTAAGTGCESSPGATGSRWRRRRRSCWPWWPAPAFRSGRPGWPWRRRSAPRR